MKKNRLLSIVTAVLMMVSMISTIPASAAAPLLVMQVSGIQSNSMAWECLDLINAERRSLGVAELVMDKYLMEIAAQRAAEIKISFSHERPQYPNRLDPNVATCFEGWSANLGYTGARAENIAYGQDTAEIAYNSWKNSPYGHHEAYINGRYVKTGLACLEILDSHNYPVHYWVQVFSSAPVKSKYTQKSDYSTTKVVKVPNTQENKDDYSVATPVITSAVSDTNHDVTVTWNGVPNATSYTLFKYSKEHNCYDSYAEIQASTSNTSYSYIDRNVIGGETVKYKVMAVRMIDGGSKAKSFYSKPKALLVKPFVPQIYETSATDTSITLKWAHCDCAGYKIYKMKSDGKFYMIKDIPGENNTEFTVTGLEPGTEYQFKMRAYFVINGEMIYSSYSPAYKVSTHAAGSVNAVINEIQEQIVPEDQDVSEKAELPAEEEYIEEDEIFFEKDEDAA